MRIPFAAMCLTVFLGGAFSADRPDRGRLVGAWQGMSVADSNNGTVWVIEDKGNTLHLMRSEGSRKIEEFECSTSGHECSGRDSGRKTIVSMWFNSGVLVQMETKGSEVVKRRFAVADQGDSMEIQTVLITPTGPTETARFTRLASVVSTR